MATAANRVVSIPADRPFVDTLARTMLRDADADPLALSAATVLLPSRRAARSLREAFLRAVDGRPLLLPRMRPLGEVDADELQLSAGLTVPSAIDPLRRELLLARLILARADLTPPPGHAVAQARALARLMDEVATARADWSRLGQLVPDELAAHWQQTVTFLEIVTRIWPEVLAEEGVIDPSVRRDRLLRAQAEAWCESPPKAPVIVAGSLGGNPAALDLMAAVASLPNGLVVLPGLDRWLDDEGWTAAGEDPTHPQHAIHVLLTRLGLEREAVPDWGEPDAGSGSADGSLRRALLSEAMRPAATTDAWRDRPRIGPGALDGLMRIDCAGPQEEAIVIALLMRDALETPGRTCALITPDRALGRRVAAVLRRWDVRLDDSAGRLLPETPVGAFLRHVADVAQTGFAPVPLLSLLKHPLAAGGRPAAELRSEVRELEIRVLRGPRPGAGFAGLRAAAGHAGGRFDRLLDDLERRLGNFAALFDGEPRPLEVFLRAHLLAAEALAADGTQSGPERLWRHEDGEVAARTLSELAVAVADFPPVAGHDYPALFLSLIARMPVRPRFGLHPRLHILGQLEARLQRFDRVILGGLNEGVWPADPNADPWMSRPMRAAFGLPSAERTIGLAAHDFTQAASAPDVVLTRSERAAGTPMVASRWLVRLDTALKAAGIDPAGLRRPGSRWLAWARALDLPDRVAPVPAPAPCPPISLRPRRLSVTEIETWMRDPYAIYARHVLRLKALDPIDAEPGAAERGQFMHQALDAFVRATGADLPDDARARLLQAGQSAIGQALERPEVWAFWWPRFERVADWFLAKERELRRERRPFATEVTGRMEIAAPSGVFLLTAKADRIDRCDDGSLVLIDYKTGTPPKQKHVASGLSPQLPLEGAIARAGGFADVEPAVVAGLEHWHLNGGAVAGRITPVSGDAETLAREAKAGLEALVAAFDDPRTPYRSVPRPALAPRFSDYAHLARIAEWAAAGGDGDMGEGSAA